MAIGALITFIIDIFYPSGNTIWVLIAVGASSFFAGFFGYLGGFKKRHKR